jgi:hypothetical protein
MSAGHRAVELEIASVELLGPCAELVEKESPNVPEAASGSRKSAPHGCMGAATRVGGRVDGPTVCAPAAHPVASAPANARAAMEP